MKQKETKWYFTKRMFVVYVLLILMIGIAFLPSSNNECEECEECKEYVFYEDNNEEWRISFINMCELYNSEVDLANTAMDYIDDFANPTDVYLTRQLKANCENLADNVE